MRAPWHNGLDTSSMSPFVVPPNVLDPITRSKNLPGSLEPGRAVHSSLKIVLAVYAVKSSRT